MRYDYYLHCAGQSSRGGVIDVGLQCFSECEFCYYRGLGGEDDFQGMKKAKFHSRENLLAMVESLAENGFIHQDITGGEPTVCPDIVEIVQRCTDLGMATRIITLGQYLMRKMHKSQNILLDDLLNAGLTNFLFSCHAVDEDMFHKITKGSWLKQKSAMDELDKRDFHYTSNTTVVESNYRFLPDIARELVKHNTYLHNWICHNTYYEWSKPGTDRSVQASYHEIYPYMKEAVKILESNGVGVNIRYAPMCAMPGLEKNIVGIVGVRHDPYEWMNTIDHKADPKFLTLEQAKSMGNRIQVHPYRAPPGAEITQPANVPDGLWAMRGNGAKVLPDICSKCKGVSVCDGIDPRYYQEKRPSLVPYTEVRGVVTKYDDGHLEAGHLDKTRLAYRAPFFVKLDPKAKMKPIVAKSFAGYVMPEKPKVSIIITCYNHEAFVRKAIESAQAQTHPCEVIVVDDASTDNSYQVIKDTLTVGADHRAIQNLTNYGQPAYTRNTGLYHAEGDFFLCLDADDWIEPTFVEECLDTLRKNPHASIAYPGTITHGTANEVWPNGEWKYQNHLYQNQFVYCSMYRRDVWEENYGYRTNVRGCEDFDFWVRAAVHGFEAVPVQRALFHYRTNNEGIYEQDVKPNFDKKYRQIVLNNYVGYPVSMVKQAKDGKEIVRVID